MRMNESNAKNMFKVIEDGRLISRITFTEAQFMSWVNTLNKINSLSFGVTILEGYLVSDYMVPSKLQDMVMPLRIQVESVNHATNYKSSKHYAYSALKITEGTPATKEVKATEPTFARILSPMEFNLISGAINGSRKLDHNQNVSVETKRTDVLLATNASKYVFEDKLDARVLEAKFVPVVISTQLYDVTMYTEDASKMFEDWFFYTMINYKSAQNA